MSPREGTSIEPLSIYLSCLMAKKTLCEKKIPLLLKVKTVSAFFFMVLLHRYNYSIQWNVISNYLDRKHLLYCLIRVHVKD